MQRDVTRQMNDIFHKLTDSQKQKVLDYASEILNQSPQDNKWRDNNFVKEMEDRYKYYKQGGKMITGEEVEAQIKELITTAKNKNV